ncbi:MAG: hypothetical protein OXN96_20180 [Bryobacterales bacterium]|nr:hypothetical protein [Bryobacterales bacterium]MDE0623027.1 hypothetical protein [Bryobacterales bacterium]
MELPRELVNQSAVAVHVFEVGRNRPTVGRQAKLRLHIIMIVLALDEARCFCGEHNESRPVWAEAGHVGTGLPAPEDLIGSKSQDQWSFADSRPARVPGSAVSCA